MIRSYLILFINVHLLIVKHLLLGNTQILIFLPWNWTQWCVWGKVRSSLFSTFTYIPTCNPSLWMRLENQRIVLPSFWPFTCYWFISTVANTQIYSHLTFFSHIQVICLDYENVQMANMDTIFWWYRCRYR